jgi:hypothetical protein
MVICYKKVFVVPKVSKINNSEEVVLEMKNLPPSKKGPWDEKTGDGFQVEFVRKS